MKKVRESRREKEGGAPLKQILNTNLWIIKGVFSLEFYGSRCILAEVQLLASLAFTHFRTAEILLPKLFMQGELPKSGTLFTVFLLLGQLLQANLRDVLCGGCWAPLEKGIWSTFPALPP